VRAQLAPQAAPCTLLFDAGGFREDAEGWTIAAIRSVATAAGGACAAAELDGMREGTMAELELETLEGGRIAKPGRTAVDGEMLEDLNFDGYRDLCIRAMSGAYNYSHVCWLFDPPSKRFRRYAKLDQHIYLTADPKTKRLVSAHRHSGPTYGETIMRWEKGELIVQRTVVSTIGERPDGKPLPPGFDRWEVVRERRGGQMVKVREGPAK
jgi:hypothetical protein